VSAYVTPIFINGRARGYESVRVKPERQQVKRPIALYARLNVGVSAIPAGERFAALFQRTLPALVASGVVAACIYQNNFWLSVTSSTALLCHASYQLSSTLRRAVKLATHSFDSQLIARIYTDEQGGGAQRSCS
jgi:aerotaxis receptor